MLESILALAIPIVGLLTAVVNLVRAIVEAKKQQKK